MHDSSQNYTDILLEQIRDQNQAVLEAVGAMRQEIGHVPKREEFDELKADVKTIRAAVTDQGRQVNDHEQRVTRLETRAAQ